MATLSHRSAMLMCVLAAGSLVGDAAAQEENLWPLENGSHDVLHSFQNPFFFSSYFHEGVDVRGSLDNVVAMRSGLVTYYNQGNSGGTMVIEVQTATGVEADSYLHVLLDPWNVGAQIQAGDVVGQVSNVYFSPGSNDHVHLNRFAPYGGGSGYVNGRTNMLHPLAKYSAAADRDPQGNAAQPQDADENGRVFWIAPANSNTSVLDFAFKDVDLILEATDRLSSTLYWNQGLVSAGYWIESFAAGEGVRSAALPYRLVSFDDAWRGSHFDCDTLVTTALLSSGAHTVEFGPNNTGWTMIANYRLTNTSGTTGSGSDIDANESWRSDARAGSGSEPNGSDALQAREIHEARFPDGSYVVHALTSDLEQELDSTYPLVVDNFRPYVERVEVQILGTGKKCYDRGWIFDSATGLLEFKDLLLHPPAIATDEKPAARITITFSEPMSEASMAQIVPSVGPLAALQSTQPILQRTRWSLTIPWTLNAELPQYRLHISGADLGGTTLYPFAVTAPVSAPFNKRENATPIQNATVDTVHLIGG